MHENTRKAIIAANTGKIHSEETKEKIRKAKSRQVLQFSLDGKLLHVYDNCKTAGISIGKSLSSISNCCIGKSKKCDNYLFLYKKDYDSNPEILNIRLKLINSYRKSAKQIIQLSLDHEIINSYPAISDASKNTNISVTSISNCLRGYSKSAGGFIWKYYGN